MKLHNKLYRTIIFSFFIILVLNIFLFAGFFESWQLKLSDSLFSEKKPLNNMVIVAIDDKSLQEVGRWPWPREVYLSLLPHFKESKIVAIDIAMFETYNKDVDAKLGDLMQEMGNVIIPVEYESFEAKDGKAYGTKVLHPAEGLAGKTDVATINIFTDFDGVARESPAYIEGVESHKGIGVKIYEKYSGKEYISKENIKVNYIGKPNSFEYVSIADILNNRTTYDFKNKIVLIGATAPDLHDDVFAPTSAGKRMPGVEVHANTAQTLITKKFINNAPLIVTILLIILFAFAVSFAISYLKLYYSAPIALVLLGLYVLISIILFDKGIIMNLIYPSLTIIISLILSIGYYYFVEMKERKKIHELFGKYVSPEVANEIISKSKEGAVTLEGEEKEVSLLFADVRGFTSISEKLKPRDVVKMLNIYLGEMTNSVFKYNGTLDKYMGDCIMAMWGAPIKDSHHALHAIKAAMEMQESISKIHKLGDLDVPHVKVGIGINSGEAIIGNMGSLQRVEYTSIGDTVNLASRLCSAAEGGQVIIGESTYQMVKDKVKVKSLGTIHVKGKEKDVAIYLVLEV